MDIEASGPTRDQGYGDARDPHGRHAQERPCSADPLACNEDESEGADGARATHGARHSRRDGVPSFILFVNVVLTMDGCARCYLWT
ncbi:hypothetical protein FB451DRAFT_1403779 [Mycena latifolia]|nr:hypothetical protein FB451DRAFT_1403779 [Mycena latifolia]